MIIREFYETRQDDINLYRTYSDLNLMIQKVGAEEIYTEAIDVENALYEYIETNEMIPSENDENQEIIAEEESDEISSEEFKTMLEEVL